MADKQNEIFSKVLRAGRRTYFFDVRETRAGDYYLTITESKRQTNEDGTYYYKKHKIYLYKEDFDNFKDALNEVMDFIIREKGREVISERHQPDYVPEASQNRENEEQTEQPAEEGENKDTNDNNDTTPFTDVNFEDLDS
jgi:hypothetical protein